MKHYDLVSYNKVDAVHPIGQVPFDCDVARALSGRWDVNLENGVGTLTAIKQYGCYS